METQSQAHCRYQLGLPSITLGLVSKVCSEFNMKMRRLMSASLYCSGSQTNNACLLECFDCRQSRYIVEMFTNQYVQTVRRAIAPSSGTTGGLQRMLFNHSRSLLVRLRAR